MRGKASKLRLFKCFTYCIKKRGRINFVLERLVEFEEKKKQRKKGYLYFRERGIAEARWWEERAICEPVRRLPWLMTELALGKA